jgi:hypothetical protein
VQPNLDLNDPSGVVNVETLCEKLPRLALVSEITERRRFFHWELEFVDIFARRGGFDLIAGNPPWVKIEWNEGGLLSERNPAFAIRKLSASGIANARAAPLAHRPVSRITSPNTRSSEGTQNFLNALQNYPLLKGQQTNLTRASSPARGNSVARMHNRLPPSRGVYDDERRLTSSRALPATALALPVSERHVSFAEVAHRAKFSVNIYGKPRAKTAFTSLANLFAVSTVDSCFDHSGTGLLPGIKSGDDDDGAASIGWTIAGHRERLIVVDDVLSLFARLYDESGTSSDEARLPALHAAPLVEVLRKFADYPPGF